MSEISKQIGLRLRGLRESLDLSVEDFITNIEISSQDYSDFEDGKKELPIDLVKKISEVYNLDISVLLFGDEPRMSSYFLTRKGRGLSTNRFSQYKYQSLAGGFNKRKVEVFEVVIEPSEKQMPIHESIHGGQEFILVLEGQMKFVIEHKEHILYEGDSIYFDSSKAHGMQPMNNKSVKFITIII